MSFAVEFGSMDAANAARTEYSEYVCPVDDDKRRKTVHFVENTPDGVQDEIEAKALEGRAEGRARSQMGGPLSEGTREKIKQYDGFDGDVSTFNWRSAKGVFEREGVPMSRFNEMLSSLADYDDPIEGAEQEIQRLRQADAGRGTNSLSGDASVGEEDILEDQRAAEQARQVQAMTSDQCRHAEDECANGDPEACEFLQETCGLDADEVALILDPPDDPGAGELPEPRDGGDADATPDRLAGLAEGPIDPAGRVQTALEDGDTEGAIEGAALGALKRSWSGYQAGVSNAEDALDQLREQWEFAQQAANAINSVRDAHGQDPLHFDRLEEFNAELSDFVRKVARDCEECHADHSDHDHGTDTGDTEDMQQAVLDGFSDTDVGTSTATETAAPEFAPDLDLDTEPLDPRGRIENAGTDAVDASDTFDAGNAGLGTGPGNPPGQWVVKESSTDPLRIVWEHTETGETHGIKDMDPDTAGSFARSRNGTFPYRSHLTYQKAIDQAMQYMQNNAGSASDTTPGADLDLDTEPLDPRGRIENAGTDADTDSLTVDVMGGWDYSEESGQKPGREPYTRHVWRRERENGLDPGPEVIAVAPKNGRESNPWTVTGGNLDMLESKQLTEEPTEKAALEWAVDWMELHEDGLPRGFFATSGGGADNADRMETFARTDAIDPNDRHANVEDAAETWEGYTLPADANGARLQQADPPLYRRGEDRKVGISPANRGGYYVIVKTRTTRRTPGLQGPLGVERGVPADEAFEILKDEVEDLTGRPWPGEEPRDLALDTEPLDPRGRIENATTGAGDPDISDLPNGFEFAGTEEYGDDMTFYNWVAPSKLPGEQTESISIRETREDFTIYAGPGDDRNPMNSGFEDFAAAYDAAAELADGMGNARRRPAGGRTDPGDVIETDPQQSLGGGRANDQARLAGSERGDTDTEIETTEPENPGGMLADERGDTTDAPSSENTEQQVPDAFRVPEGGQDSLSDF